MSFMMIAGPVGADSVTVRDLSSLNLLVRASFSLNLSSEGGDGCDLRDQNTPLFFLKGPGRKKPKYFLCFEIVSETQRHLLLAERI